MPRSEYGEYLEVNLDENHDLFSLILWLSISSSFLGLDPLGLPPEPPENLILCRSPWDRKLLLGCVDTDFFEKMDLD